jgi:phosphate-selective porin OprO/OprP
MSGDYPINHRSIGEIILEILLSSILPTLPVRPVSQPRDRIARKCLILRPFSIRVGSNDRLQCSNMRPRGFTVCALVGLSIIVPVSAVAQPDEGPRTGVYWRNRPSIQLGPLRVDLRLKLQLDQRWFDPEIGEDDFDFRVRRWGISGELADDLEFQIERDFDGRWRDVFANWRTFRQLEVMAGRFKVPFGHEELIGITDVDFAFRTLVSTTIPPARDQGVMVHGRFLQRGFTYQVGVFKDDGDNGRLQEPQFTLSGDIPNLGPSFAARVTATPFRPLAETFEDLRVGFAFGGVDMPEGLNSFRGETVYGTEEFFEPVYVKGRRTRVGLEFNYTPGPVGVTGEWMRASEERKNQSLRSEDLSDLLTTGWYVSVTSFLTGEEKDSFNNNPRNPLFDGGFGGVEVGVRYEELGFESEEKIGPAFPNPRAEHIRPNSDHVWTFGVNWFVNRWVRVTLNSIREEFEDPFRTPIPRTLEEPGVTTFWSGVARLQIVF